MSRLWWSPRARRFSANQATVVVVVDVDDDDDDDDGNRKCRAYPSRAPSSGS